MVRRRAAKATALNVEGARGANGNGLENGEFKATVGCAHLEEQYFASPKRKDCKVENPTNEMLPNGEQIFKKEIQAHGKTKSSSATSKTKNERGGIAGRTIGVPLATRSQTRTIENFFKAKSAANNVKLQDNVEAKSVTAYAAEGQKCENMPHYSEAQPPTPDTLCEPDEDTNDSEYSAPLADETVFDSDYLIHRSQLRDSHSSTGSACTNTSNTENIFLQEPVLTLNVDKTPNQATSIKIRTSLELEAVFSSPPSLNSTLNGRFNQIVSLNMQKISPSKREPFSSDRENMAIAVRHEDNAVQELVPEPINDIENGNDNDNSSCDSGVVFNNSIKRELLCEEHNDKIGATAAFGQTRRRKPATPHRIVCPSPIKTVPHVISPMYSVNANGRISSPPGRKLNKELSPRKSPRQMKNIHSKSRRRLNQQNEFSILNDEDEAAKQLSIGCAFAMNNHNVAEAIEQPNIKCVDHEEGITKQIHKCTSVDDDLKQPQKLMPAKCHIVKTQSNKCKSQNRLPEFFPVRRSVRKTKTAVEEEIMRTLEKAIIEEQADGLKVAHFEGKGRGVIADRHFPRGEFVVEYIGELISMAEASDREQRYALDENAGCYMYYFKHKNQQYCIDATENTGKLGRLVNHSRNGNLVTKVVVVKQRPHLILLAKDDIEPGEELTYDYGDRTKESLLHHPWLAF